MCLVYVGWSYTCSNCVSDHTLWRWEKEQQREEAAAAGGLDDPPPPAKRKHKKHKVHECGYCHQAKSCKC